MCQTLNYIYLRDSGLQEEICRAVILIVEKSIKKANTYIKLLYQSMARFTRVQK
jgi:hypothetical protein